MERSDAPLGPEPQPIRSHVREPLAALVGRSREQAILRDELSVAAGGHGRLVLLGGEAGIGKTALVRDLARDAAEQGARVIVGHCYDLTNTPPYGPWLEAFRDLSIEAGRLAPSGDIRFDRPGQVVDQAELFENVQQCIEQLARVQPILVLMEDLHWADPASIELLRYLGRSMHRSPVLIVATYRLDELTRQHPLFQHLPDLIRETDAARVEPQPLDAQALRELVQSRYRLPPPDEARLVSYLTRHSDGNPFFAVELLRALEDDGLLRAGEDRSTLGELARVVVPTLIQHVIEGRIARMGDDTRQPLAIAAVIGQDVSLSLWAKLANLDEERLLALVEILVGAHLIEAPRMGTHVRFVHALTREAIYDEIVAPRRRVWHRVVGETLANDPRADPDEVAVQFQLAGDPRAWKWLVRAGNRAQAVYAWRTAAERFREAADLIAGVKGQERTHLELVKRYAFLVRFFDTESSLDALDNLERLVALVGDPADAAEVRFVRGIHLCYADRFAAGQAEMLASIEYFESLPPDPARAYAAIQFWFSGGMAEEPKTLPLEDEILVARLHEAGLDYRRCVYLWDFAAVGPPAEAVSSCERFLAILDAAPGTNGGIGSTAAFIFHGLGYAYASLGRPDDARSARDRARELFLEIDHFALLAFSLLSELRDIELRYGAANPGARRRIAADAERAIGRAGGAFRPGITPRMAWLGSLILDGRWDEADAVLESLAAPGNAYLRREITADTGFLARERGNTEEAWSVIQTVLPEGPATRPGNTIHQEGLQLQRLAAQLCLDAGDLALARDWLESQTQWLEWSGTVLGRADEALAWALWHHAAGERERARVKAREATGLATSPEQPLVRLSALRLLGEIDTAAGHFADAEAHLVASLSLADVCETPFERALTLLTLAELKLAQGERAAELLDEARQTCIRLRARLALTRIDAIQTRIDAQASIDTLPARLTPRELDVLRLLTQHRTDREIADLLFISPHTASTHVKHVLSKLGAASRREAAEVAADHGVS